MALTRKFFKIGHTRPCRPHANSVARVRANKVPQSKYTSRGGASTGYFTSKFTWVPGSSKSSWLVKTLYSYRVVRASGDHLRPTYRRTCGAPSRAGLRRVWRVESHTPGRARPRVRARGWATGRACASSVKSSPASVRGGQVRARGSACPRVTDAPPNPARAEALYRQVCVRGGRGVARAT